MSFIIIQHTIKDVLIFKFFLNLHKKKEEVINYLLKVIYTYINILIIIIN